MLQNLEKITYNTADSAPRQILQLDIMLVMGEAKETHSSLCRGITLQNHSRVALHCQVLEMPHLECCIGFKLLNRRTN